MQYMSRAGYDPQGAVELQKTFVQLFKGKQQDWLSGLFASHPPSEERVQNNRQTLATLPAGGDSGKQQFQQKIAHLRKTAPAYKAYDEGRKALADDDISKAQQLASKARRLEPREAHFVALQGDIELKKGNRKTALKRYRQAVGLNNDFFYYHLKKGLVNEQLGNRAQAKQDLNKSVELLPTANAYNSLGNIARTEKRYDAAKAYYAKASRDTSTPGQQALASLVELDLPDNPGKYLSVKLGVDKRGRTLAQVTNNTPKSVSGVVVGLQLTDSSGRRRNGEIDVRSAIEAGKSVNVDLGLDNLDKTILQTLRAGVIRAKVVR
jgi:tetratricopeptide (TPR) repeat protein